MVVSRAAGKGVAGLSAILLPRRGCRCVPQAVVCWPAAEGGPAAVFAARAWKPGHCPRRYRLTRPLGRECGLLREDHDLCRMSAEPSFCEDVRSLIQR